MENNKDNKTKSKPNQKRAKDVTKINNPSGKGGFKKGKSGNPAGRKPVSPEIKAIRDAVKEDLYGTFYWLSRLTPAELRDIDRSSLTMLQAGMLVTFKKFIRTGDFFWIKYPLDHIIGKAKESLDIKSEGGNITFVVTKDFVPNFSATNANNVNQSSEPAKSES